MTAGGADRNGGIDRDGPRACAMLRLDRLADALASHTPLTCKTAVIAVRAG